MRYRPFGKTGISISALGFGAMRLPSTSAGGKTVFDTEESIRIMRRAFELGVNYFDTAPYYCDGESEIIVGKALKGIRDKSPSTTPRITCPRSSTRAPSNASLPVQPPRPLQRGRLPGKVQSSPEIALRFVLTNPGVTCALSGMGSMARWSRRTRE